MHFARRKLPRACNENVRVWIDVSCGGQARASLLHSVWLHVNSRLVGRRILTTRLGHMLIEFVEPSFADLGSSTSSCLPQFCPLAVSSTQTTPDHMTDVFRCSIRKTPT
eukprot:s1838_g26.t1